MNIYHEIKEIDGKNVVLLYVEYPDEYEFSLDFDAFKRNVSNVAEKIHDYALKSLGGFSDNTALLILNGVVIGTLLLTNLTAPKPQKPQTEIETVETSTLSSTTTQENNDNKENESSNENETKIEEINELKTEEPKTETNTVNTATPSSTNTKAQSSNNAQTNQTTPKKTTSSNTSSNNKSNTNNNTQTQSSGRSINVKLASGQIKSMDLEEYVIGVVGAEMPAEFHNEALKAQAVASRTYALKKTASGGTISATISDQVYNTVDQLKQKWGSSFDKYYNKIKSAVNATKGQCLTYNGSYIEALFFSTSNGKTEDAVNVWGNSFPYLKSVDSSWDTSVSGFIQTKSIPMSEISSKLGVNLTSISQINITSKTEGDRVKEVTFCDKSFTGVKVRQLLGLRSADFEVSQSENNIIFKTKGYGHGVGMSQYGANGMAKSGYSYSQILKHYYSGVSIVTK